MNKTKTIWKLAKNLAICAFFTVGCTGLVILVNLMDKVG